MEQKRYKRTIACGVYSGIYEAFKLVCKSTGTTANQQLTELMESYVHEDLDLNVIQGMFEKAKERYESNGSHNRVQTTFRPVSTIYTAFVDKLKQAKVKPATGINLLCGYFVAINTREIEAGRLKNQRETALNILKSVPEAVQYVIYAIKFSRYDSSKRTWVLNETPQYLLHSCTLKEFEEIYNVNTPLIKVYYVERSDLQ